MFHLPRFFRRVPFFLLSFLLFSAASFAQTGRMFDPLLLPTPNDVRTGEGAPGARYWQNEAHYKIDVALDADKNQVIGTETIRYVNHAPNSLSYVWIQLDQNIFAPNSAGSVINPSNRFSGATQDGGFKLGDIYVTQNGKRYAPKFSIEDTQMRLDLAENLDAQNGEVQIEMAWHFSIPKYGADRMGELDTEQGRIYEIAQWYPRMAVYDNVEGWNTMPYLGQGEFYLDYGNFEVNITVPASMIVAATGVLQNPEAVLTAEQLRRYNEAKTSEKTVVIVKAEEVGTAANRPATSGNLTWKFKAENVRDVAWSASKAFVWDGAMWDDDNGEPVLLMSVYPKESIGDKEAPGWEESTQMLRHTVKTYSNMLLRYPYPTMINVAGVVAGMEYPMIVFCSAGDRAESLFDVTDHEFGHSWFPMIVGSDERRYAWMDEGFNTFINFYSKNAYYSLNPAKVWEINASMQSGPQTPLPLMTYPDNMSDWMLGNLAYEKPGFGLVLLREYILGHERFDRAFRTYVDRWKFKHPQPADFFRTIEDVSGEDLAWFWRQWFYSSVTMDMSLAKALDISEEGKVGFTVVNNAPSIYPLTVDVAFVDGTTKRYRYPVSVWFSGATSFSTYVDGKQASIKSITLDPDQILPDADRTNDVWKPAPTVKPKPKPRPRTRSTRPTRNTRTSNRR